MSTNTGGTKVKPLRPKAGILMDPTRKSPRAIEFESKLSSLIVGQDRAVRKLASMFQVYLAGMCNPDRPIGSLLFMGPTGSGKTRAVEAAAEILFADSRAVVKIDCAEFQHSHEIAKLIGSPPGYLGHRETSPMLTQENLDKAHTQDARLTFVLFDEIEKASDSLWQLLLGILDKATLSLGDNRKVNFSRSLVIMTSNLGSKEMSNLLGNRIGFAKKRDFEMSRKEMEGIDQKIYHTALEAAKKRFSPEFMNRLDRVVVFRSLQEEHLKLILEIELTQIQNRITEYAGTKYVFDCSDRMKQFLLREGIDLKSGARHLGRALERFLVFPMANLVATQQIETGDFLFVDYDNKQGKASFRKQSNKLLLNSVIEDEVRTTNSAELRSAA